MKVLHRRSTKRVAAFTTALATAAFVVQLAAPAAFAATAPDNVGSFFPVHDGADTTFFHDVPGAAASDSTEMAVLSDLGDGVDSTAHLTAVTAAADTGPPVVTGATLVQWYFCTAAGPPTCPSANLIGADTTATSALKTPTYTGGSIDDAWSIAWDIPASLDGETRNIVVVGCNGTPDATFSNCTQDSVPNVLLDDAGSGNNPQTSSGEITSPANGSALSDSATLTMTASTSPELTAVGFGFDPSADSGDDGDGPAGSDDVDTFGGSTGAGVYNDLTPNTTTATAKTWSVSPTGADTPDNDEQALTLWSTNQSMNFTGSGGAAPGGVASFECVGCDATPGGMAFDRHYEVLEPGVAGVALQARLKKSSDVTADATCLTGPSSIFASAASTVNLTGCVFDAFGTAVGSEGVFWSLVNVPATGGGSFTGSPQLVTDTSGHATANVTSTAASGGSSTTVTFCIDHDKNAVCDGPPPPPATNTKAATFTISWSAAAVAHARSISLRLKDALVARGRVTVTDGFAACADSVPVRVQRRVSGHWKTVKKTTTSATGAYRAHLRNKHGRYRSLAPAVIKGTDTCSRAVSPRRRH